MYPLVLASSSAYRKTLLARLAQPFEAVAPDIDEQPLPGEAPEAMVRRLSEAKARALAEQFPAHLIIGSDQVAVIGDQVLTKPGNFEGASQQLRAQSGRRVRFLTGVAVLNSQTGRCSIDLVPTDVVFKKLADEEIRSYLRRDEPYNCAGSFRSEGLGICLFDAIHSTDPSALIGLPLIRLCQMLREHGYNLL
ncbi:Maf family protein [Porticoccus sp.]